MQDTIAEACLILNEESSGIIEENFTIPYHMLILYE